MHDGVMAMTNRKKLQNGWTRVALDVKRRRKANNAIEFMRRQHDRKTTVCPHGMSWRMHCAHSVACAYGKDASGWDAFDGWQATMEKHQRDGRRKTDPPRGALVFYRGKTDDDYGHVCLSNGRGMIWTNDAPVLGRIGLVSVTFPVTQWGYTLVGWVWPDEVAGW